jgi:hypothetical protein
MIVPDETLQLGGVYSGLTAVAGVCAMAPTGDLSARRAPREGLWLVVVTGAVRVGRVQGWAGGPLALAVAASAHVGRGRGEECGGARPRPEWVVLPVGACLPWPARPVSVAAQASWS